MKVDQLLLLSARRLHVALLVAEAKYPSGAIEDLKREAAVIEAAGQSAGQYGVRPDLARDFMARQIEASKRAQQAFFATWRAAGRGKWRRAPDLTGDVRPVLDDLTPKLMRALAQVQPLLGRPGAATLIRERAGLLSAGAPEYAQAWAAAVAALLDHAGRSWRAGYRPQLLFRRNGESRRGLDRNSGNAGRIHAVRPFLR